MILPNAVIAGTPRSGTTSLFRWLADHPQVCASTAKETRFLLDRSDPLFQPRCNVHHHGLEAYSTFFPDQTAAAGARILLEATPHYLYQETAFDVLSRMERQPHIVIVLRRPAERVYSSFQYTRHNLGAELERLSFRQFVDSLRRGNPDPSQTPVDGPLVTRELAYSCYVNYLERWRNAFPPDRFHLLVFEPLVSRPRSVVQSLAERLGIDPGFYEAYDFPQFNATLPVKSALVQRMARRMGRIVPAGGLKRSMKRLYRALQRERRAPSTDNERGFLWELERDFAPFNDRLSREFHLDLSSWR